MCVYSMIADHYITKWSPIVQGLPNVGTPYPMITQAEVDEFRELLDRAREYDRKHHEPDCGIEEKRQKIRELARQLGIDVSFV